MACRLDIVITVDSSNSVYDNGNKQYMEDFIAEFIAEFSTELSSGDVQIGLVHFDSGPICSINSLSASAAPISYLQNHVQYLTSDSQLLSIWNHVAYPDGVYPNGIGVSPPSTDIVGGVWMGLNVLYGNNSRPGVEKRLITIFDGPHALQYNDPVCGQYLGANSDINYPFTGATLTAADVFNPIAVGQGYSSHQLIKSIPNCPADYDSGGTVLGNSNWQTGHSSDVWFQTRIVNNSDFSDLRTYSVLVSPNGGFQIFDPTTGYSPRLEYAKAWAHPGNMYWGTFTHTHPSYNTSTIASSIRQYACDEVLPIEIDPDRGPRTPPGLYPVDPNLEPQTGPNCHKIDKAWHIYACPCDWTPKLINTQYSGVVTDLYATPPIVSATYDAFAGKAYSKDIWYCENNDTGQTEVAMDYPLSQIDGWQPQVGDRFHACDPGVECFEHNSNQIDNGGVWNGCSGYPSNITNTANDILKIFFIDSSGPVVEQQGQVPRPQYVMPNFPGNVLGQIDWTSYPVRNYRSTKHACDDTEPYPDSQSLRTTVEVTETDSLNILLKNFGLSSANEGSEFLNHTLVRLPDPTTTNPLCNFALLSPCVISSGLYWFSQSTLDIQTFMYNMDIHFNNVQNGWPNAVWGGCAWFQNRLDLWNSQLVNITAPIHHAQKSAKIAWAECMQVHCCEFEPDPSGIAIDPNAVVDTESVEYMNDPLPKGDDISHTEIDFEDKTTKY